MAQPCSINCRMNASALYASTDTLSSLNNNSPDIFKTILIKNLPKSAPQVVTTTNTLRRCWGFALALIGFLFYCARIAFNSILILYLKLASDKESSALSLDLNVFLLEFVVCVLGIGMFLRIMRNPMLTLMESNFRNVWIFSLIPILSFSKVSLAHNSPSYFSQTLPLMESFFYTGYIYGLSLNGRSSSIWAGCKPFYFEVVPLILPIPPASRAFPQYTVPINKV